MKTLINLNSKPWWLSDNYDLPGANDGPNMDAPELWGPHGPALVPLFDNGKTAPGWGLTEKKGEGPGFMVRYNRLDFTPRRVLHGYAKGHHAFAWIMRSAKLVCIDIDGKNGGFDHVSELGYLPPTCAEVSMSGNGYHLFYLVDDEWSETEGFGRYSDAIGIVTGVDFRGTGCVYHKPTQRWNMTALAKLPEHLSTKLLHRTQQRSQQSITIKKTLELEPEDIAIMHDQLIDELNKPIQRGKRNNTLFAIGSQLKAAEVENWDKLVGDRAAQVGLGYTEIEKLIANIENYGG